MTFALIIIVSVAKCCTTALSAFIPCSLWYSYKYIVAKMQEHIPVFLGRCSDVPVFVFLERLIALDTFPGPELYDANTNSQFQKNTY
jgi:hypothetical protein